MSAAAITARFATTASYFIRVALQRFGLGPLVIAATAAAALLYSWRTRANPHTTARQRPRTRPAAPARSSSSPAFSSVRRVTIGTELAPNTESVIFQIVDQPSTSLDRPSTDIDPVASHKLIVRPDTVQPLKQFAKSFDLYFITRVDTDEAELDVKAALKSAGLFEPGLLDERKVIFCQTAIGRVSVARQLEPQLHVDESLQVVSGLQRFISSVALLSPNAKSIAAPSASNVMHFTSLSSFFS